MKRDTLSYIIIKQAEHKSEHLVNKRPMGHIAHMRNQFKSINTFVQSNAYIITLICRGKNDHLLFITEWSLFVKHWVPFIKGCFVPSFVEIGSVVLKKIFVFKFRQFIFAISWLSPFGKGRDPSFEQTWIPFSQGCFVPRLFEIGPVVLEKRMNMRKVYRRSDGRTDGRTTGDQKSSLKLLAQVS